MIYGVIKGDSYDGDNQGRGERMSVGPAGAL